MVLTSCPERSRARCLRTGIDAVAVASDPEASCRAAAAVSYSAYLDVETKAAVLRAADAS
jgi:hypothetical protein